MEITLEALATTPVVRIATVCILSSLCKNKMKKDADHKRAERFCRDPPLSDKKIR
jgi:hypothetical protein